MIGWKTGKASEESVQRLVTSLAIPNPWNLTVFMESVAKIRGKPIRIIAFPGLSKPGRPNGIWVARDSDDIILYDDTTSEYHAEQIILHEVGHMLLEHGNIAAQATMCETAERPARPLAAHTLHVLCYSEFDTHQESQAELFASLVMSDKRPRVPASKLLDTFLSD